MMKLFTLIMFSFFAIKSSNTAIIFFMLLLIYFSFQLNLVYPLAFTSEMFFVDSISFTLLSLSIMVLVSMHLVSVLNIFTFAFNKIFVFLTSLLLLTLLLVFSVNSLFSFYIFFEASIIPTFMLILGWGGQPERSQAGKYMLLYTVFSSLPLLFSIILFHEYNYNSLFFFPHSFSLPHIYTQVWAISFLLAFMVKLPLYMVHMWLPKAHVEAPVAGSMVLAAMLLKLGGYGLIRFSQVLPNLIMTVNQIFMTWACVGGVSAAVLCVFQTDIKVLIAMSSVAHMTLVLTGVLSFSNWGLSGAVVIMIGHGFCSSGLFCIANLIYERSNTRSMFLLKNTQMILPALVVWWFLLCITNMASPPSLNLLGEIMSISSTFAWSLSFSPLLFALVFLAAAYSIYLYSSTQHGKYSLFSSFSKPLSLREHLLLLIHWSPLNLLFLCAIILF